MEEKGWGAKTLLISKLRLDYLLLVPPVIDGLRLKISHSCPPPPPLSEETLVSEENRILEHFKSCFLNAHNLYWLIMDHSRAHGLFYWFTINRSDDSSNTLFVNTNGACSHSTRDKKLFGEYFLSRFYIVIQIVYKK